MPLDAVALSQALIRCPSVTPQDAGALGVLETALKPLGFACKRLRFEAADTAPVENLYARIGSGEPHFCFAGHTDVVPVGDGALWKHDPFGAGIVEGTLYGRGAVDMKAAIAAFAAAAGRHLSKGALKGSISLLVTGDEEGIGINGTKKMLGWLSENGERIDHCIVGEPTSSVSSGDTLKIGRRGSINFRIAVRGVQGHVGYPHRALNPIPILAVLVNRLSGEPLDTGTPHFEPSTLAFTSVDVGNDATNVIPAEASARFNIRFNDLHTPETLKHRIETKAKEVADEMGGEISVISQTSGVAFLTQPGPFTELVSEAVAKVTGSKPEFSTSGGTSDARFIKDHCPVVELGLSGATMHKVDECVPVSEILRLTDIYESVLDAYFAQK
ncbi:MAG TPA: succinyl-diaminopimelate desuccinylase [Rhizomicrobium sp.]|jgi:succinyl-diaminopimelate desuccinylase|nr:succinyl-diaminopimelate desuccinylase [Rhizomicrobium sp.]